MNDDLTWWLVEQYVDLGNEMFWHERARLLQHRHETDEDMHLKCIKIGGRVVLKYDGRFRIRVVREQTVFDSGKRAQA